MAKKPQNTAGNRNEDSAPQERKWPDKAIIRYIIRALVLLDCICVGTGKP